MALIDQGENCLAFINKIGGVLNSILVSTHVFDLYFKYCHYLLLVCAGI